ncbi:hypothetical protein SOM12_00060 [Flavobacterium sp. CFBP9031]|uniref:hypothetical protein n=1 Tax=Flavobacterium sp. CFBP9031 TaxID=3096538 RepID=UPI002A6B4B52|nr:hypothetical protein [Flavobacterium sp. CFBP9031]MDY0985796.1 hypothetical protein [Flavobacterium sp. CFBP9031]
MKLKYLLLIATLLLTNYSFSCECMPIDKENMIEKGLKQSEIVFYGEVIKVDSIKRTFTFRIIELFKGKYNSQYIKGKEFTSCSILPIQKQLWIVYANFKKDKTIIDISGCSPSMGFKPYQNYFLPPPPPKDPLLISKDEKINLLSNCVWKLKYENQNIQDWIYHLEKLRAYKTFENQNLEKEKQSKIESYSQYIIISLIVNIVLFLTLLFVILKKKNFAK